ncbi:hypothetical protein [Marinomonas lutimaris]|uniref:hypothetical protein n=1 Tax=Marinomonas lutimaris TaxID=2846746 RepID=UPI001CA50953|nr:hypothetical protein [Marinomonas lutimaris]
MTSKRYSGPLVDQWFNELDAVIQHDILCYLVECRVLETDESSFDGFQFLSIDHELMEAMHIYLDNILEVEDETNLANLEPTVGSLVGYNQTERFLDEQDFLIQVIERKRYEELSGQAREALTNRYPLAINTVKYLIEKIDEQPLPPCLWSQKLNEHFRIDKLWYDNKLDDILIFHTILMKSLEENKKNICQIIQKKPELVISNKKYQYIDIVLEEHKGEVQLVSNYKLSKILELEEPYRQRVLDYCDNLQKNNIDNYIKNVTSATSIHNKYTSVPPSRKNLASRYDGYSSLLIGLYCIKNEHLYKKINYREYEVEFDSFRDFVEKSLYEKFDFLNDSFNIWREKNKTHCESDDLKSYIDNTLTKRIKLNIKKVRDIVKEFEIIYFPTN